MARLFQSFVGGELTADILAGGTSMSSGALEALVEVVPPDYIEVTLDPDGILGYPEIVQVTNHTAASATATITAVTRKHKAGIEWVASVSAQDFQQARSAIPTHYRAAGVVSESDLQTSSTGFVDVDPTNLVITIPDCEVGDLVDLTVFYQAWSSTTEHVYLDVRVDLPLSADVSIGELETGALDGLAFHYGNEIYAEAATGAYTVTEAGDHSFYLQWRVSSALGYLAAGGQAGRVTVPKMRAVHWPASQVA